MSDDMAEDVSTEELPKSKLSELYKMVDENKPKLIDVLKTAVAIPSVSHETKHISDILKMFDFCKEQLEDLGAVVEIIENTALSDNGTPLPPVLFGNLFVNDKLKTICVYGHIDTPSAEKGDGWKTDPFELIEKDGRLYGCGASNNKGPLLCWFNALQFYKTTKNDIPVNIKFVIEGMAELRSQNLDTIVRIKREFFSDVEYVCLTIDKKLRETPCLKYGFRGICHFTLEVSCGKKNVHSGTYGGAFNQPLLDTVNIIGSLIDKHGKIDIPDVLRDIVPVPSSEEELCKNLPFSVDKLKQETGARCLKHKEKTMRLILHKTRLPSISIHSFGMEINSIDKKNLASISNRILAKFSIRLVPNQTANETYRHLDNYVKKVWQKYKSVNQYTLKMNLGIDPWKENPLNPHYQAAASAIETLYNIKPTYIREGYTIPAVSILNTICVGSSLLVLPISDYDDALQKNEESISVIDYINGIKLVMAYMCHVYEI